ncbi:forkhead box protein O-like isoform X3 [Sitodiplosis mosellana]|uniref:forkhead box protein O-like isoform X3 n=1 Tax=Sitodiplosis mosellana TaxID=263140 RepID=UPI0024452A61|nr:forkhead box protein O-like isoform X3 [Sitodiplosis mosellana]XP_055326150.1 forkhead box protein O-like isoform X3 [Sitodiplosis mosellana]
MDSFNATWPSPDGLESISNDGIQTMDLVTDLQESFEPLQRARSNTWPLPRPENFVDPEESESKKCSNQQLSTNDSQQVTLPNLAAQKKNSSRRNAWGNLSYADLITQAITSAVDNRLTLSQIYEWMVQNVPYFKDKGDSNSSAGWKNSIRHNLSLHNRFMRVQNEGTGKSSWWMLNPDAKPGKSVRRRAASMETSKYEKRRGRVKKQVESLKNGGLASLSGMNEASSPSSTGFQLSPDFRQRASSNASSAGRLSPIPSVIDLDPSWNQYTTISQDFDTNSLGCNNLQGTTDGAIQINQCPTLDQLAGSLADDLNIQNDFMQGFNPVVTVQNQPPPPPYQQPSRTYSMNAANALQAYAVSQQQTQCPIHQRQPCSCTQNSTEQHVTPPSCISPSYPNNVLSQNFKAAINSIKVPPVNSTPNLVKSNTNKDLTDMPSTLMGQFMEALNSQTNLDDLNLNIDSFQGGLECNVDELIQQELNIDGLLDINIPISTHYTGSHLNQTQNTSIGLPMPQTSDATKLHSVQSTTQSAGVTSPSWVH